MKTTYRLRTRLPLQSQKRKNNYLWVLPFDHHRYIQIKNETAFQIKKNDTPLCLLIRQDTGIKITDWRIYVEISTKWHVDNSFKSEDGQKKCHQGKECVFGCWVYLLSWNVGVARYHAFSQSTTCSAVVRVRRQYWLGSKGAHARRPIAECRRFKGRRYGRQRVLF